MGKMNKDKLVILIKELVKERLEKGRGLLTAPLSNKLDKFLSERLEQIIKKKK
jgi:hypothetical protein|tara:strand:- start:1937 stop:2095 length:159 start_codon:yes stop_codon:yes gene_type:complete